MTWRGTRTRKQKSNRLSIEFKDRPLTTEFDDFGIGYIGTVKLANYKQFLKAENGDIRDDLFESNIRHFQGLVDVNKKIKNTIFFMTVNYWKKMYSSIRQEKKVESDSYGLNL